MAAIREFPEDRKLASQELARPDPSGGRSLPDKAAICTGMSSRLLAKFRALCSGKAGVRDCSQATEGRCWTLALLAVLAGTTLSGCATIEPAGKPLDRDAIDALNQNVATTTYRLTPGDRLAIKFFYNKDLNDEVTVQPDGRISLQLVGEVDAAGQTPQELGSVLTHAYARSLGTSPDQYLLSIGEKLSVKSFYHDKLNEDVVIRPDGMISLQLVGEIRAAGISPKQLASDISERLRKYIDSPDISVIVRDFRRPELAVSVRESAAQRVYVGGEVKQAGVLPLQGRMGLLAATLQAGGALESARLDGVVLLRHLEAQEPAVYSVNLRAILQGEMPDIALRPMDVVFVPKSASSETAAMLRQYIYNLLPNQFMLSVGYQINPRVDVKDK